LRLALSSPARHRILDPHKNIFVSSSGFMHEIKMRTSKISKRKSYPAAIDLKFDKIFFSAKMPWGKLKREEKQTLD